MIVKRILCIGLLVLLLPHARAAEKSPSKPNILFILCDDLGYGDLGCFGNSIIETPNLDKMARNGLKLTQFYSPAPVCSPSRAGFLTGRHPYRLGIRDWIPANSGIFLKKDEVTIPKLLRTAGYRTGHIGKWHLNSRLDGSEPTPGDHGYDHWMATQNNAAPSHENPVNFVRNGRAVGPLKGNSSTLIVDEALRFMDGTKDQPFFLAVWFHAPHEPVATPREYTSRYQRFDDETKRIYYGSVSLVDHEVGRLMRGLEERKLRETTFVLFTSDNGPETLRRYKGAERSHGSPGPWRGMKLHVHEAGYRVPALLSWPGHTPVGKTCGEAVCGVDLLPTCCRLAGVDRPTDRALDGVDFLPILKGKSLERSEPLYWQYDRAISRPWQLSLLQGPWKLLADGAMKRFELYHLDDDPREARDRSAEEPERVKAMAAVLARRHREVNGVASER
jgi:arylsulfatase A